MIPASKNFKPRQLQHSNCNRMNFRRMAFQAKSWMNCRFLQVAAPRSPPPEGSGNSSAKSSEHPAIEIHQPGLKTMPLKFINQHPKPSPVKPISRQPQNLSTESHPIRTSISEMLSG
jgi:hypothetical protein